MSNRTALATQPGYRLLMAGDRIKQGDEALQADAVTWLPVFGWSFGMRYQPGPMLLPHRRPLVVGQQEALSGEVLAPGPEWISVHDGLPETNTRVLGFDGENVEFCQLGEFWGNGHPYLWAAENYGHDGCHGKFNCTHWMRIPAVPKRPVTNVKARKAKTD